MSENDPLLGHGRQIQALSDDASAGSGIVAGVAHVHVHARVGETAEMEADHGRTDRQFAHDKGAVDPCHD